MNKMPLPVRPRATTASIDTVEVFARWLPRDVLRLVWEVTGEHLQVTRLRYGRLVAINRPPLGVLPVLANLVADRRHAACASRIDVAYDFLMESKEAADRLTAWIDRIVALKWRSRRTRRWSVGNTIYWCDRHKGRNIALYRKPGNIVRLELRFFRAQTVKQSGLEDLMRLPTIDPKALFDHHVGGRRVAEGFKIRTIQKTVKEDARRHLQNPRSSNFTDHYRSTIAKRVGDMLDRAYHVHELPTQLERVDLGFLDIPQRVTWPH